MTRSGPAASKSPLAVLLVFAFLGGVVVVADACATTRGGGASPERGQKYYMAKCQACHPNGGQGAGPAVIGKAMPGPLQRGGSGRHGVPGPEWDSLMQYIQQLNGGGAAAQAPAAAAPPAAAPAPAAVNQTTPMTTAPPATAAQATAQGDAQAGTSPPVMTVPQQQAPAAPVAPGMQQCNCNCQCPQVPAGSLSDCRCQCACAPPAR